MINMYCLNSELIFLNSAAPFYILLAKQNKAHKAI